MSSLSQRCSVSGPGDKEDPPTLSAPVPHPQSCLILGYYCLALGSPPKHGRGPLKHTDGSTAIAEALAAKTVANYSLQVYLSVYFLLPAPRPPPPHLTHLSLCPIGEITTTSLLDRETKSEYILIVRAVDGGVGHNQKTGIATVSTSLPCRPAPSSLLTFGLSHQASGYHVLNKGETLSAENCHWGRKALPLGHRTPTTE